MCVFACMLYVYVVCVPGASIGQKKALYCQGLVVGDCELLVLVASLARFFLLRIECTSDVRSISGSTCWKAEYVNSEPGSPPYSHERF